MRGRAGQPVGPVTPRGEGPADDVLRKVNWMDTIWQDLRYGARAALRNPWASALMILTLGLGIGANTAIFSMVNGVLLQPLPYVDGHELMRVQQSWPRTTANAQNLSVLELGDMRVSNQTFESLVEYHTMFFNLLSHGEPERVQTGVVSWNFFDVLGITPIHGRLFTAEEDHLAAEPVVLLGYEYWQRRFGSDPEIVGEVVEMNNRMHTVVGVLPPVPTYPNENDVWMPWYACPFRASDNWHTNRGIRALTVIGRVTDDAGGAPRAAEDLTRAMNDMVVANAADYPPDDAPTALVTPLKEELTSGARTAFLVLLGISGFVLLIACANVANLTLAKLSKRWQELGVRSALGADRKRLTVQLLTESTMLAVIGGGLGIVLAYAMMGRLSTFAENFTPRAGEVGIDPWVLLFTLLVAILTGVAVGTVPAWFTGRGVSSSIREGGQKASAGAGRSRIRDALVVSQVAVAFVLLFGAGLMIRSLGNIQSVDPGFAPERVLSMRVDLDWARYQGAQARQEFFEELLRTTRDLPQITDIGVGSTIPLSQGGIMLSNLEVEDPGTGVSAEPLGVNFHGVSAGYLDALGVRVLAGRTIEESDRADAAPVAVVSQSVVERFFPDQSPDRAIGARVRIDGGDWLQVVGVVGNIRDRSLEVEDDGQVYIPLFQSGMAGSMASTIVARGTSDPLLLAGGIADEVAAIDPRQPVSFVQTMEEVYRSSFASPRLTTVLLGLFSSLALLISAAGILGVVGYSVGQRTREIGIRMALGAGRSDVLRSVMAGGVITVIVGLALGAVAALFLSGFLESMLFGVTTRDTTTLISVAAILTGVAVAAAYLPARRATRIDPVVAFKAE